METNTLRYDNLYEVLDDFIKDLANVYKRKLQKDGKRASGGLISSVIPQRIDVNNGVYTASISVADYWKWVENGRKPGKFPPPDKIVNWIKAKPILPREVNGIKPTTDQLAYLIVRKIAKEGIKPGNQLRDAVDEVYDKYIQKISDAIDKDINNALIIINSTLDKY